MAKILLIIRTVRHLKFIQVWNRVWRKRPIRIGRTVGELSPRTDGPRIRWPEFPAVWDGDRTFAFLNESRNVECPGDWNRAEWPRLWLYNLHYFDCLRQKNAPADDACLRLILRWIDENAVGEGNGWDPYPISLRVVNWIKWLSRRPACGALSLRKVEESLVLQFRWLEKHLEYHLLANHLLANAKALVFGGRYFSGIEADGWYCRGMDVYRHELPRQTCADGVNFELSPMYHSVIIEDVLDCFNFTGDRFFADSSTAMIAGLGKLVAPDGRISLFNDSSYGIALSPDILRSYASALGVEPCGRQEAFARGPASGYVRRASGAYALIAKTGEIGPGYQPGHAHADTFSFELWRGSVKLVGDTGCSTYDPGPCRSYERSTAAHNCVIIDGCDSSEMWAAHRVARRARVLAVASGGGGAVSGVYEDYRGNRILRTFALGADGLRGTDEIRLRRGCGGRGVEIRFHLPPGLSAADVDIACDGIRRVEACDMSVGWNRREKGLCVVFRAEAHPAGRPIVFRWHVA